MPYQRSENGAARRAAEQPLSYLPRIQTLDFNVYHKLADFLSLTPGLRVHPPFFFCQIIPPRHDTFATCMSMSTPGPGPGPRLTAAHATLSDSQIIVYASSFTPASFTSSSSSLIDPFPLTSLLDRSNLLDLVGVGEDGREVLRHAPLIRRQIGAYTRPPFGST
jgi:hypothetical protein